MILEFMLMNRQFYKMCMQRGCYIQIEWVLKMDEFAGNELNLPDIFYYWQLCAVKRKKNVMFRKVIRIIICTIIQFDKKKQIGHVYLSAPKQKQK